MCLQFLKTVSEADEESDEGISINTFFLLLPILSYL